MERPTTATQMTNKNTDFTGNHISYNIPMDEAGAVMDGGGALMDDSRKFPLPLMDDVEGTEGDDCCRGDPGGVCVMPCIVLSLLDAITAPDKTLMSFNVETHAIAVPALAASPRSGWSTTASAGA